MLIVQQKDVLLRQLMGAVERNVNLAEASRLKTGDYIRLALDVVVYPETDEKMTYYSYRQFPWARVQRAELVDSQAECIIQMQTHKPNLHSLARITIRGRLMDERGLFERHDLYSLQVYIPLASPVIVMGEDHPWREYL